MTREKVMKVQNKTLSKTNVFFVCNKLLSAFIVSLPGGLFRTVYKISLDTSKLYRTLQTSKTELN